MAVRPRTLQPAIAPDARSGRFVERRIFIDAPPETVWRVLVDPNHGGRLVPEAGLGEPLSTTWPAAGSQRRAVQRMGLLRETGRATSVEARPGTTFWIRVESPSVRTDWTWRLDPVAGGTRVVHVAAVSAHGRLAALLIRLGRRDLGTLVDQHLSALAGHLAERRRESDSAA